PDLFFAGVRPAINVGISVSRVGGAAQVKAMKSVAGKLKLEMAQFREVQAFAQFASDLDKATQQQLARGQRFNELLKQDIYTPYSVEDQVISIFSGVGGYFDPIEVRDIKEFEKGLLGYVYEKYPDLIEKLRTTKEWTPDVEENARKAISEFQHQFLEGKKSAAPVEAAS
ncbi:MAG: F0F1 ATP synthase subunit alpha, partial [Armatimonadetes bacterium]|nr:F0F1 ATP synthase subunit alpha [Armatimonadota bacterium]